MKQHPSMLSLLNLLLSIQFYNQLIVPTDILQKVLSSPLEFYLVFIFIYSTKNVSKDTSKIRGNLLFEIVIYVGLPLHLLLWKCDRFLTIFHVLTFFHKFYVFSMCNAIQSNLKSCWVESLNVFCLWLECLVPLNMTKSNLNRLQFTTTDMHS